MRLLTTLYEVKAQARLGRRTESTPIRLVTVGDRAFPVAGSRLEQSAN